MFVIIRFILSHHCQRTLSRYISYVCSVRIRMLYVHGYYARLTRFLYFTLFLFCIRMRCLLILWTSHTFLYFTLSLFCIWMLNVYGYYVRLTRFSHLPYVCSVYVSCLVLCITRYFLHFTLCSVYVCFEYAWYYVRLTRFFYTFPVSISFKLIHTKGGGQLASRIGCTWSLAILDKVTGWLNQTVDTIRLIHCTVSVLG